LDEKKHREEELLNIEKNYRGLNDEVDQMRDRFKDIKKKYVASLTELRDIQIEHENDK
jgi:predicted  nucleic acid-binding Zn-ribbon protein